MNVDRRNLLCRTLFASSAMAASAGIAGCSPGYAATGIVAPDLEDGYIVFNAGGNSGGATPYNAWLTTVECALKRHALGPTQVAYLGKECRAESVSETAFDGRANYEFVGVKGWDGNYLIRHGAEVTPEIEYQKVPADLVQQGFEFEVHAGDRLAQKIGYGETLSMLQRRSGLPMHRLFVQLTYQLGGDTFTLFMRCKYVNFPHPSSNVETYLQPITGRVLVWESGRLRLAYAVFHLRQGVVEGLQFKILDRINVPELIAFDFLRTITVDADSATADFYYYGS